MFSRVELQEENKRLRLQATEVQSLLSKKVWYYDLVLALLAVDVLSILQPYNVWHSLWSLVVPTLVFVFLLSLSLMPEVRVQADTAVLVFCVLNFEQHLKQLNYLEPWKMSVSIPQVAFVLYLLSGVCERFCVCLWISSALQDNELKQQLSRVRQLEDDAASAPASSDSTESNSLVEENTMLKMEISHLRSKVKEAAAVNGTTATDNNKEVTQLREQVASLEKSLETERKSSKGDHVKVSVLV